MKAEISIPESLSEVSLSNYQKLIDVINKNPEAYDFIQQKTIELICGIPFDLVTKIKLKDFNSLVKDVNILLEEKPKLYSRFTLNGVEYGMIPNIADDLQVDEFVDLGAYFDDWEQMHKAMAVLYRPITKSYKHQYTIEEYEGSDKYALALKNMPVSVVLGARFFFRKLGIELSKATLNSLSPESEEGIKLRQTLEQNGVGISQFTHSLEEIYLNSN